MMMIGKNVYKTKDFYLSATLISKEGFELVGSDKRENGVYFHISFKDEIKKHKIVQEFIDHTSSVNVRRFTKALSILRRELDKYKNK